MSYTLESVAQLVNQVLLVNKTMEERLAQMQAQLAALQVAAAPKPRGKSSSSTPVGVDGASQSASKFPNNTVVWIKRRASEDPNFMSNILGQENYDRFVNKYIQTGEFKDVESKDLAGKYAEKIWKDLGVLAEKCDIVETKKFAVNTVAYLRKTWKEEKTAHDAAHASSTPASAPATNGVIVPDTPTIVTSPLLQLDQTQQAPAFQPVFQPLPVMLSLTQPHALPAR